MIRVLYTHVLMHASIHTHTQSHIHVEEKIDTERSEWEMMRRNRIQTKKTKQQNVTYWILSQRGEWDAIAPCELTHKTSLKMGTHTSAYTLIYTEWKRYRNGKESEKEKEKRKQMWVEIKIKN